MIEQRVSAPLRRVEEGDASGRRGWAVGVEDAEHALPLCGLQRIDDTRREAILAVGDLIDVLNRGDRDLHVPGDGAHDELQALPIHAIHRRLAAPCVLREHRARHAAGKALLVAVAGSHALPLGLARDLLREDPIVVARCRRQQHRRQGALRRDGSILVVARGRLGMQLLHRLATPSVRGAAPEQSHLVEATRLPPLIAAPMKAAPMKAGMAVLCGVQRPCAKRA
mmetsp:Transcript_62262/g.179097  ORF Transcript_62262/g.179097 Transcript_62262/m.179097 type:complete len:225 (-) Transcript_62262:9-683(-)